MIFFFFPGGTGILWWLYADYNYSFSNNSTTVFGKAVAADNGKALLVYAIGATIFTVCNFHNFWAFLLKKIFGIQLFVTLNTECTNKKKTKKT